MQPKPSLSGYRFAYARLDWSELRPHLAGAPGAVVLDAALKRKWAFQDLHRRELMTRFGISL
jgi:hypothetical protein